MNFTNYIAIGGLITLILLIIEVMTGLRIIKVKVKWHKLLAFIILGFAIIHGLLAFLYFYGIISF